MEGNTNNLDIFEYLRKVKKVTNFNFSLMSREERIAYIIAEMEKIEEKNPEMVQYIEEQTEDNNDDLLR